jgi:Rab5 GDP/GTP exchange factor
LVCISTKELTLGLIRQSHLTNKDTSADSFLPLLILLLLRSNPPHLYSNIQYIQRFRHPDRLGGEGGYYLNSLEAAVGWIETIEKGVLSCSEEDFDRYTEENPQTNSSNVEAAVAKIAERHRLETEALALEAQSAPPSPARMSTPHALLDRTSRLTLPAQDRERGEILGPTRDLLVSGSGKVVGAVKKPLKGLGSLVFREGSETPPLTEAGTSAGEEGTSPREREDEAAVRLANAEIERAERAEREQRGQTLEMLVQMFPGICFH